MIQVLVKPVDPIKLAYTHNIQYAHIIVQGKRKKLIIKELSVRRISRFQYTTAALKY